MMRQRGTAGRGGPEAVACRLRVSAPTVNGQGGECASVVYCKLVKNDSVRSKSRKRRSNDMFGRGKRILVENCFSKRGTISRTRPHGNRLVSDLGPRLEHFPGRSNREGFPSRHESDSRFPLGQGASHEWRSQPIGASASRDVRSA